MGYKKEINTKCTNHNIDFEVILVTYFHTAKIKVRNYSLKVAIVSSVFQWYFQMIRQDVTFFKKITKDIEILQKKGVYRRKDF